MLLVYFVIGGFVAGMCVVKDPITISSKEPGLTLMAYVLAMAIWTVFWPVSLGWLFGKIFLK